MDSYLGEIRMFGGNYPPQGWALCNGQLLSISGNEALFSLLGTTYGGDGVSTFALPDLQGRLPIHANTTYSLGSKAGTESVTLTSNELPQHTHIAIAAESPGDSKAPSVEKIWSASPTLDYSAAGTTVPMNPQSITPVGGNLPHSNIMPSLVISFIISLEGLYPPHN